MPATCVCQKPADQVCSRCKTVSYCSRECQQRDWKAHKSLCKAPLMGSSQQIEELLRLSSALPRMNDDRAKALGLKPQFINGICGYEYYAIKAGGEVSQEQLVDFWGMDEAHRARADSDARECNAKSAQFLKEELKPITESKEWVDIVLDAILHSKIPVAEWHRAYVNGRILSSLFPHLHTFTPEQNGRLLNIFAVLAKNEDERYDQSETLALFAHGKPTPNLVDQLVGRCLGPSASKIEVIQTLLCHVALPIQKHWPDVADTRILDCAFALLMRYRGSRAENPVAEIIEIAQTSVTACKHLLPALLAVYTARVYSFPEGGATLLDIFGIFGIAVDEDTHVYRVLYQDMEMADDLGPLADHLRLMRLQNLPRFNLVARDYSDMEVRQLRAEALRRLRAFNIDV